MPSLSRGLCAHVLSFSNRPLSLSRSALLQPFPARIIDHGHIPISTHLFSTLHSLHASSAKPTTTTLSPPPTSSKLRPAKPIPSTATRPQPPSPAYAALLASKSSPTLLYESPSQFWFTFSAFNAGLFCMSYTVVQYWSVFLSPPPGLAWWVPHGYAVICGFMATIGFYWMRWPSRVVRSISAVPVRPAKGTNTPASLELEVATRPWLPLLPLKKRRFSLEEVHVPARVAALVVAASGTAGAPQLGERERIQAAKLEEERKEKARQYELDHIMTAPFRHFVVGVKAAFRGMARALTREGFAKIKTKKSELKLDVKGGWFLEEGKALDRLVHVKAEEHKLLKRD